MYEYEVVFGCLSWSLVPDPWILQGGIAQLGERVLCKHEVIGSIPFTSTTITLTGD
jgi:hypothetical protein